MPVDPEMDDPRMAEKARYAAKRRGWRAIKSRQQQHANNEGGFMLVNENNIVIDGANYELSPSEVIALCETPLERRDREDEELGRKLREAREREAAQRAKPVAKATGSLLPKLPLPPHLQRKE